MRQKRNLSPEKQAKLQKQILEREVLSSTSIGLEPAKQYDHAIRVFDKSVDLYCESKSAWVSLTPVIDITRDVAHCPCCGQKLQTQVVCDKFNTLVPPKVMVENHLGDLKPMV